LIFIKVHVTNVHIFSIQVICPIIEQLLVSTSMIILKQLFWNL